MKIIQPERTRLTNFLEGNGSNKSIKLGEYNDNYPKCEPDGKEGYWLVTATKRIYSKWKTTGNNTMKVIAQSKWVKAGVNVQKGDILIIRSEGKLEASQMDATKMEYHFDVELPNGEVKDAKFNKTSIENLTSGFGTNDSAEWLGKEIVVDDVVRYAKGAGCVYAVKK